MSFFDRGPAEPGKTGQEVYMFMPCKQADITCTGIDNDNNNEQV